jgi:hypothetical protein
VPPTLPSLFLLGLRAPVREGPCDEGPTHAEPASRLRSAHASRRLA